LKGHGFSRAEIEAEIAPALQAAEKLSESAKSAKNIPQGLKARTDFKGLIGTTKVVP
jgi:hypothetical protein